MSLWDMRLGCPPAVDSPETARKTARKTAHPSDCPSVCLHELSISTAARRLGLSKVWGAQLSATSMAASRLLTSSRLVGPP